MSAERRPYRVTIASGPAVHATDEVEGEDALHAAMRRLHALHEHRRQGYVQLEPRTPLTITVSEPDGSDRRPLRRP